MWYVFPQLRGLGSSRMSDFYGIGSIEEAKAYVNDEVLGARLVEITDALLARDLPVAEMFGRTDSLKLRSCTTLFGFVSENPIFQSVIDKCFGGDLDGRSREILFALALRGTDKLDFVKFLYLFCPNQYNCHVDCLNHGITIGYAGSPAGQPLCRADDGMMAIVS